MDSQKKYSIVCAVNDEDVLYDNLLKSPEIHEHDFHLRYDYDHVCKAYNSAKPLQEIVIYAHQDVYLPAGFFKQLDTAIHELDYARWGVLGVAGRIMNEYCGYLLDRGKRWGDPIDLPARVQTLDELLLVVHNGMFKFDEHIPHHHLFGADLCMQAASIGRMNFAIKAYCEHNSSQEYELPKEFEESKEYIRNKWWHMLPIYTTCTVIEK